MIEKKKTIPENSPLKSSSDEFVFVGNVYIFHAFDIGDEILFEDIRKSRIINTVPLQVPRYFKNYHMPLAIELPHPHESSRIISCKIHNFGAASLTYKIPFKSSLESLRKQFEEMHTQCQKKSMIDLRILFRNIQGHIVQPKLFQTHSYYTVIQIDSLPPHIKPTEFKEKYGGVIASTLRFETKSLSEQQKNEILEAAIGYFRGDLIIIDSDATFMYDPEYEDVLDLFEFANIQQLELRYFDRVLDQQLNKIYEGAYRKTPWRSYIPFTSASRNDPMTALGKLRADISVITERLESSIKLASEPYYAELYAVLKEKLDLSNWQQAIERKLGIIRDVQDTFQHHIEVSRQDLLEATIVALILIELILGVVGRF